MLSSYLLRGNLRILFLSFLIASLLIPNYYYQYLLFSGCVIVNPNAEMKTIVVLPGINF